LKVERLLLGDIEYPDQADRGVDRKAAQRLYRLARLQLQHEIQEIDRFAEVAQEINLQAIPDVGSPGGPATPDGQPNLAIVATVMPPLLALTAFLIWLVLLGLIAVTVLAIRRGRTDAT